MGSGVEDRCVLAAWGGRVGGVDPRHCDLISTFQSGHARGAASSDTHSNWVGCGDCVPSTHDANSTLAARPVLRSAVHSVALFEGTLLTYSSQPGHRAVLQPRWGASFAGSVKVPRSSSSRTPPTARVRPSSGTLTIPRCTVGTPEPARRHFRPVTCYRG